jgi:NDP-sugar pyrophosphorylase family protein
VRALILSAGFGMRLRPLTYVRAKAAVPVNGEAIVRRVVRWLVDNDISDLVVNLHHQPASVAAVLGDGGDLDARIRYSWEHPVLGSAGGPRHALPLLTDSDGAREQSFLLINGDTLTSLPLGDIADTHRQSGADVTMALTRNPRPDVYGGVLVDGGYVTGFSRPGAGRESFHFIGVQVAEPRAFSHLDDGVPAESVMQVYPALMAQNPRAIAAHIADAPFHDIGRPADYLQTSLDLAASEGDRLIGRVNVTIDPSAELRRTAVWDNVAIGADAVLYDCIVGDGVEIPAGARYRRCAIVPAGTSAPHTGEQVEGQLLVKPF